MLCILLVVVTVKTSDESGKAKAAADVKTSFRKRGKRTRAKSREDLAYIVEALDYCLEIDVASSAHF